MDDSHTTQVIEPSVLVAVVNPVEHEHTLPVGEGVHVPPPQGLSPPGGLTCLLFSVAMP